MLTNWSSPGGGSSGGGGTSFTGQSVSGNISLANAKIYYVDTSAPRTLTLPTAAVDIVFYIKDVTGTSGTNNITVARFAAESIENIAGNKILQTNFGQWFFACDGTNWWIIG